MSNEEINYWLETFEETRHTFMSKDGKTLSFYDTFKTMKDLQNNWNELKKELKEKIDICDGCIDTMQSDLQEIAPRGNGKSYLTSEIFKNKVAKISFEFTLKNMQELEGNNE